jgi:hypothetical protein
MKTLWILAAAAMFAACAKSSDEEVGAAPDRGDTTAVTTQVDTATGQWDTTGATGDVTQPADTGLTPTTPTDTTVGQYPAPTDTTGYGGGVDTTMTTPTAPDTGAYVPDTGAAGVDTTAYPTEPSTGVDTSGMDSGMGTDTTTSPSEPSVPADPGAEDPNQAPPQ